VLVIVLFDTNIIFSAILKPDGTPMQAYRKAVTPPNRLVICEQTLEELRRTFRVKFPDTMPQLERFLEAALPHIKVVPIPNQPIADEALIRDESDRPIFRAAVAAGAEMLVTGDKDFLESGIENPKIMTAAEFVSI
jgi:putative PIN family toxin of toxin-antitoxin system